MGALAGAAFDADAQPSKKPEFSEVFPSGGFNVQDQTLHGLFKKNPKSVQDAYFLAVPLDEAAYASESQLEDGLIALSRKGEPRIGAKENELWRTYDVFVFAGTTADGLPVIKYVPSAERDYKECYIPTRVKGYWEQNGQRYYLTDLNLGQVSGDSGTSYECDQVRPYVPPVEGAQEAAQVAVVNTLDSVDPGNKTGEPDSTLNLVLKTPASETAQLAEQNSSVEAVGGHAPASHHLQAAVLLGGGVEELGHASLGAEGTARVQGLYTLPGAPIGIGLSSTFLFTPEASGLYGFNVPMGYHGERFGLYLAPGISLEPRRPETTLNGSFGLALEATGELWSKGALGIECAAGIHTRLYGGAPVPGLNVSCGGTWDFVLHGKERAPHTDAVVAVAEPEVEVRPDVQEPVVENPLRLVKKEVPYVPNESPIFPEDPVKRASAVLSEEEMEKGASRNLWGKVEGAYQQFLDQKLPMSFNVYWYGACAARGLGDIEEAYERLLAAQKNGGSSSVNRVASDRELEDWLSEIEAIYASVDLRSARGVSSEPITLTVASVPFDPAKREAIAQAQTELAQQGYYTGFLPAIDGEENMVYTYGGIEFTLEPIGPRDDEDGQQTQVIRLEKNKK